MDIEGIEPTQAEAAEYLIESKLRLENPAEPFISEYMELARQSPGLKPWARPQQLADDSIIAWHFFIRYQPEDAEDAGRVMLEIDRRHQTRVGDSKRRPAV